LDQIQNLITGKTMNIIIKLISLIILLLFSTISNANGLFTANEQDNTMSKLVERWAQIEGRHAKWMTVDFTILDFDELNKFANLNEANTIEIAITRLLKTLRTISIKNYGLPLDSNTELFACFYEKGDVAIVISSFEKSPCLKQ